MFKIIRDTAALHGAIKNGGQDLSNTPTKVFKAGKSITLPSRALGTVPDAHINEDVQGDGRETAQNRWISREGNRVNDSSALPSQILSTEKERESDCDAYCKRLACQEVMERQTGYWCAERTLALRLPEVVRLAE